MAVCATAGASAGQSAFHAKVTVESATPRKDVSNANVVVWLTPLTGEIPPVEPKLVRLAQHNKQF